MKSLNTKKIVAMATGAALLGSALLGAVSYQNTELINENGVPMAKVVVGSNAHISDGVAAANIAAVLGNMAFKAVSVEATVNGINGLSCDVSGEGAGACSVLSKSVDLEVVTPAGTIPAGAYGFNTLINDYIDSNLENRDYETSSDKEETPMDSSKNIAAKKIGASDFTVLADYSVSDPQSSFSTVEKQYIYIGNTDGVRVYYDDDSSVSDFKAEDIRMAYEIEFEDYGIPVCSDSKSNSWAYCKYQEGFIDTDKQIENHRMEVMFLGEKWIISEMNAPNDDYGDDVPPTNEEIEGGSIKLAKESAYSPKLQIGESLDLGDGNRLVLGDLKPASGDQKQDTAIFSVLNAANEEIASRTVMAGNTVEVTAGSATYRVRVYQVAPGYTLTEKWAEVAVFANELELKNGEDLENNDDYPDNWEVKLQWKDKDTNTNTTHGKYVDHLHKIQLVSGSNKDILVGESISVVEDPAKFRLTFSGLDLTEDDYTRVDITLSTSAVDFYTVKPGDTTNDEVKFTTGKTGLTSSPHVVRIQAASDIFEVFNADGSSKSKYNTNVLMYSLVGGYNSTHVYSNLTGDDSSGPVLLFLEGSRYYAVNASYNSALSVGDMFNITIHYKVDKIADMKISGTVADEDAGSASDYEEILITFVEDSDNNQEDAIVARLVEENGKLNRYVFDAYEDSGSDNYDELLYAVANNTLNIDALATERVELPYFTERGSEIRGTKSSMRINLAKKVGKPTFLLQYAGAEQTEEGVMTYSNLHEGDSINVLGATIRVKNINVETSDCVVEGGEGVVTGVEGLSCVINANVANLGERQDIPTDLVVMDRAATNVETVIAVGGPMVNDVTAALLATESPLNSAGDYYVEEVGAGKIVVAGYTADDTMTAAMNFIATLKGQ